MWPGPEMSKLTAVSWCESKTINRPIEYLCVNWKEWSKPKSRRTQSIQLPKLHPTGVWSIPQEKHVHCNRRPRGDVSKTTGLTFRQLKHLTLGEYSAQVSLFEINAEVPRILHGGKKFQNQVSPPKSNTWSPCHNILGYLGVCFLYSCWQSVHLNVRGEVKQLSILQLE